MNHDPLCRTSRSNKPECHTEQGPPPYIGCPTTTLQIPSTEEVTEEALVDQAQHPNIIPSRLYSISPTRTTPASPAPPNQPTMFSTPTAAHFSVALYPSNSGRQHHIEVFKDSFSSRQLSRLFDHRDGDGVMRRHIMNKVLYRYERQAQRLPSNRVLKIVGTMDTKGRVKVTSCVDGYPMSNTVGR